MRIGLGGAITVTATERWLSEIRAGRAFIGNRVQVASAANFGHIQLLNPAGSAVTIIVRAIVLSLGAATRARMAYFDTALTTLVGTGANLLRGAAASVGTIRAEDNAAELGTEIYNINILSGTPTDPVPEWLCELGAGEGVLINCALVNTAILGNFLWMEV